MKETFLLWAAIVASPDCVGAAEEIGCAWWVAWQINYLEITHFSHSIPFLSWEVFRVPIILSHLVLLFCPGVVAISSWLNWLASCGSWRPRLQLAPLGTCPLSPASIFQTFFPLRSCQLHVVFLCIHLHFFLLEPHCSCDCLHLAVSGVCSASQFSSMCRFSSSESVSGLASQWILVS